MDTLEEGDEMTVARELEDRQLWDLEEEMFYIEEDFWKKNERALGAVEVSMRHTKEFLRREEKVLRGKEKFLRRRGELLRMREERLEDVLVKSGENSKVGNDLGLEGVIAQQLLPGIPNEVTLELITTKLSRREIHVLKSVSRGWYRAIRDRRVHDTRVHSHLTETFLFLEYSNGSLALRCLRDNSSFEPGIELPGISHHGVRGSSRKYISEFVAVDGKVYVLGGVFDGPSDKVYMLDLAVGQRSWTQVASMHIARSDFACNVMGGKIYVFGGSAIDQHLRESEVYDPKENTWSFIKPMCSLMRYGQSTPVGEELCVYGFDDSNTSVGEVYHPVKDEWRKVEPFGPFDGPIFGSGGRVYSMTESGIWLYSLEGNLTTHVCSHSFTAIESAYSVHFTPENVLAMEDYLLAFGYLSTRVGYQTYVVLRSKGFDIEQEELEWHEDRGWGPDEVIYYVFPIHL